MHTSMNPTVRLVVNKLLTVHMVCISLFCIFSPV